MRILFLLLVLGNLAFFTWRYYVEQYAPGVADPVAQQLNPERIKLVAPDALARVVASRKQAACVELGPIASGDATRAEEAVAGLAVGLKVAQRRVDEPGRWWVYIAPPASRQAAVQRIAELRRQGIDDISIISDDSSWRNAISLGVFRSEDAAAKRLEDLRRRGVRGAEMAPREGGGPRVYVQLRDAPELVRARFVDLRDGFPGADVRECP